MNMRRSNSSRMYHIGRRNRSFLSENSIVPSKGGIRAACVHLGRALIIPRVGEVVDGPTFGGLSAFLDLGGFAPGQYVSENKLLFVTAHLVISNFVFKNVFPNATAF